jgi:polyvinyl alcohol dehydrogenase (cytochrome)
MTVTSAERIKARSWFSDARAAVLPFLGCAVLALPAVTGAARPVLSPMPSMRLTGSSVSSIGPSDWPGYLHGPYHSSAAASVPAITPARAAGLTTAWTWAAPAASGPSNGLTASPTVVGNTVYIGAGTGNFYALNASTGAVRWTRQLDSLSAHQAGSCLRSGIDSTATVAPAPGNGALTVYVAGARYLYALDAATGKQRWRTLVGPPGSLNAVGYRNYSSPTVIAGKVLMGLTSNCDQPLVRGGVQAFSQASGALLSTWYSVPAGKVGGSVWSSVASDGTSLYVSTGNPDPTGNQVYDGYSIVRLSLATLTEQDRYTVSLPLTADKDFGSSPTLFTGTVGGVSTPMVGACNKNGVYYAWRRSALAAGPVWQRQVGATSHEPDMCISSAAWDIGPGKLYIAANSTTINGGHVAAAVRQVDPSTGSYGWQTPLPCVPLVSPSLNSSTGLLAISTWCNSGQSRTYLVSTATGTIIGSYPQPGASFVQPVWAGTQLYYGGGIFSSGKLLALR